MRKVASLLAQALKLLAQALKKELKNLKERPLLSGTLASLLATGVLALVGATLATAQGPQKSVPLWVLLIVLVFLFATFIALFTTLVSLYRVRRSRIFITFSAFGYNRFFAQLLKDVLVALRADPQFESTVVVVRVPERDYNREDQAQIFEDILTCRRDYKAGIIVPIDPYNTKAEIRKFVEDFGKPVLFLDVEPFEINREYPDYTAFVGYDSYAGGEEAAEAMAQVLSKANISQPQILVIGSNCQQIDRQKGFKDRLEELKPYARITKDERGHMNRNEAYKVTRERITEYIGDDKAHGPPPFDGVFCTSDEMAIGATEALLTLLPKDQYDRVIVIGYDAIEDAKLLIKHGNTPLKNTVEQNTKVLAKQAIEVLHQLVRKEKVQVITKLSPPIHK